MRLNSAPGVKERDGGAEGGVTSSCDTEGGLRRGGLVYATQARPSRRFAFSVPTARGSSIRANATTGITAGQSPTGGPVLVSLRFRAPTFKPLRTEGKGIASRLCGSAAILSGTRSRLFAAPGDPETKPSDVGEIGGSAKEEAAIHSRQMDKPVVSIRWWSRSRQQEDGSRRPSCRGARDGTSQDGRYARGGVQVGHNPPKRLS